MFNYNFLLYLVLTFGNVLCASHVPLRTLKLRTVVYIIVAPQESLVNF